MMKEEELNFYLSRFDLNEKEKDQFSVVLERLSKVYLNIDVIILIYNLYMIMYSFLMIRMIPLIKNLLSKLRFYVLK